MSYMLQNFVSGLGGGWCGSADRNGGRARWFYHEMCPRSEWKSCYSKVHWVCSWRSNTIYYLSILWSSSFTFHSSLWLPCHSGSMLIICFFFFFFFLWLFTIYWFDPFVAIEGPGTLWWFKYATNYHGWNHEICMHSGSRSIRELCYSGIYFRFGSWYVFYKKVFFIFFLRIIW